MRLRAPRWQQVVQLGAAYWLAGRVGYGLGELIGHLGDRDLEKRVGQPVVERAIFAAMTRRYDPEAGEGFRGTISFELTRPQSGGVSSWWTVSVDEDGAQAHSGRPPDRTAALSARLPMADFLRIAGGVIDPVEPVLAGRAAVSGDLGVAVRLAEMFGAPRAR